MANDLLVGLLCRPTQGVQTCSRYAQKQEACLKNEEQVQHGHCIKVDWCFILVRGISVLSGSCNSQVLSE